MNTPGSDEQGVRQIIRALRAAGYRLVMVFDGEEEIAVSTESAAIEAIFAVDMAHLHVKHPETGVTGWVWFVLGNDPEEVAADYTVTLSHVIDPLTDSWW